ncbi:UNVERIFIED_CONTAM: hypothetical protein RF653_12325 [Kocuria sp. CPCC 205316]|uniref:hypothetical protein n=1 Tax=Kocuria TaxID=57493 RepID=UPI0036DBA213
MIAVAAPLLLTGALAAPPAHADHTRQHTCEQAGGVFTAGSTQNLDRCVVTTSTSVTGPFGRPTNTNSEPRPDGTSSIFFDGPTTPTGETTTDSQERNVGDQTNVETVVAGTPTTAERTERGAPTSTAAPGTVNCERVNNDNGRRSVERCERAVVTTTTTPTTVVTTVTTPRTERTVATQAREECITTTQQTSFVRTTTQGQVRDETITYQQRTITTTTTTTNRYANNTTGPLVPVVFAGGAPNPRVQTQTTPAEPLVETRTVPVQPSMTTETLPGDPIVGEPVCAPTTPVVTPSERELEPLVVETRRPGEPIVETSTRGTGQTCYNNPSNAEQRRNTCS